MKNKNCTLQKNQNMLGDFFIKNKIISLACILCMLVSLISSCGNMNTGDIVTTTSPSYIVMPIFPKHTQVK